MIHFKPIIALIAPLFLINACESPPQGDLRKLASANRSDDNDNDKDPNTNPTSNSGDAQPTPNNGGNNGGNGPAPTQNPSNKTKPSALNWDGKTFLGDKHFSIVPTE